jgi:hypothetical protein
MYEKIQESISQNAMTPSVAHAFVRTLMTSRSGFMETVTSTRVGLENLLPKMEEGESLKPFRKWKRLS